MPNVKITLDGVQYEVDQKKTIIEAARENKVHIPHFCWHDKLSAAGNCRVCLVEVEKMPKLAIACMTQVADGMVVNTKNERVINAREAVLEFILINHPLDCPICDEAGECKLQDYAYKYSKGFSRFVENKVHKPKRVEVGPHVMLDAERCIMCSRCIRFCDEIAGEHQLQFVQRGDRVELTTFPGEALDNQYSMNVVDICPVGALTNKDFRFKSRVWEMSFTDSICHGCARGCNVEIGVRNNEILRLHPRKNDDVNSVWMCDHGRLDTWKSVNAENRIKSPMIRKEGQLVEVGWDEAIAKVASELKSFGKNEIAVLGSAFATNEDNYVFAKFAKEVLGTKNIDFARHLKGENDTVLIRADKTPNAVGAEIVGVHPSESGLSFEKIIAGIKEGKIKAVYALECDFASLPGVEEVLTKLEFLAVHATNENMTTKYADVVFAASTYAEKNGTMTNFQYRVQRIRPAVTTLEQDRALDNFEMSRWDKFASHNDKWGKGPRRDARPSWKIVASIAGVMGTKYKFNNADDVFNEICQKIEGFKGLSFLKVGKKGAALKQTTFAV
ncbi:MAG: 2Fe-2S iron-sulfur cluster-binding protein [Bacteriovoracaceae bacterium]|nr:2Fe-2S iron-sulfur cluster-binding protein [Bacteroidota bacterium]